MSILLLVAIVPVFFPFEWMNQISQSIGTGRILDTSLINYLTRSLSMMYVFMGLAILYTSFNVRRYLPMICFFACAGFLFGGGMLTLDIVAKMPRSWTMSEGPFIMAMNAVLLWLTFRVDNAHRLEKSA